MADASSIRAAAVLPGATGRMASSIRYSNNEAWLATGTQWSPLGRVVLSLPGVAIPSNAGACVFIADRPYQLVSVTRAFAVQSTGAATLNVVKVADGVDSGVTSTAMIAAPVSMQGTAHTLAAASLSATAANSVMATGDRLFISTSAAVTGLAGANVTVVLHPV